MRTIPKPTIDVRDVFKDSITKVRNANLKMRLVACEDAIAAASEDYDEKATIEELRTCHYPQVTNGDVTKAEMKGVYDRMINKDNPGRVHYDTLMSMPNSDKCPLCGQRAVSTLDHHVPRDAQPIFIVTPFNLVPTCKDCNFNKLHTVAKSPSEEAFHPYYDDFNDAMWLEASLVQLCPPVVSFTTLSPNTWTQVKIDRLENHFRLLKLKSLYESEGAEELVGILGHLIKLFDSGGADLVQKYLLDIAASQRSHKLNSWQTALYLELSTSKPYCEGGFRF